MVDPDDSEDSIFRLTAIGADSRLVATSTFTDVLVTQVDDQGPDDEPGQKDLNQMSSDLGVDLAITWNWDDTDAGNLGGNTIDACSLIDTDQAGPGLGFADFAFCVVADGNPASKVANYLYSCNDTRSDRCAGPSLIPTFASTSTASVVPNSDPFRLAPFNTAHNDGNDCDDDANCLTSDTIANVTLKLADVGGASVAKLLNVCSYPSQEPNSDPSDCVVTPDSGFLTIKKTVENVVTASLFPKTFTFNASAAGRNGVSSWQYQASGNVSLATVVLQEPYAIGTTLDLNEVDPGNGWSRDPRRRAPCRLRLPLRPAHPQPRALTTSPSRTVSKPSAPSRTPKTWKTLTPG